MYIWSDLLLTPNDNSNEGKNITAKQPSTIPLPSAEPALTQGWSSCCLFLNSSIFHKKLLISERTENPANGLQNKNQIKAFRTHYLNMVSLCSASLQRTTAVKFLRHVCPLSQPAPLSPQAQLLSIHLAQSRGQWKIPPTAPDKTNAWNMAENKLVSSLMRSQKLLHQINITLL